ncbi:MAG: 2-hydroxyacyl-CoA dehydratase family protein, partial [Dehalococcoidia bacterium]|nr:2-hydroxyacyl-CoA dehydratase family protein [Dehalococcoidia bacterium]
LKGEPIAMTGFFIPVELLVAMDIPHVCAENNAVFTSQLEMSNVPRLLEIGEGYGLSSEVCSPHRVAVALAKSKRMPRPSVVVSTSTTCDQTLKLYEVLADLYDVPCYLLDSVYSNDQRSVNYARQDVLGLVDFLEEHTGRKLEMGKLLEAVKYSKQLYDCWDEICELRKARPCPVSAREAVKDFTIMLSSSGRIEGVRYFQTRRDELKARVDKGQGIGVEEKYRIAWLYVLPMFDMKIADWLMEQHGAMIVMDTFGYANPGVVLDTSDPINFLAKKAIKWGFVCTTYGPNETTGFTKIMASLCKEYAVDAAICYAHWSCNQYCGTIKLLRDEITAITDCEFLILDGDLLDFRIVSSDQIKARLNEFMGMIKAKKGMA